LQLFKLGLLGIFSFLFSGLVLSKDLSYAAVNEDDIIISSLLLDKKRLAGSVDLYRKNNHLLVAIEPFFDLLQIRYQVSPSQLIVWKNSVSHTYTFTINAASKDTMLWADDGYYQLIDLRELETLFEFTSTFDQSNLTLAIKTHDYKFPLTILEETAYLRLRNQISSGNEKSTNAGQLNITIPDQYNLFTLPHGQINARLNDTSRTDMDYSLSTQIVSDFLYHSMRLNVNKSKSNDISGGLTLSKYKNSPNDNLLGAFDMYSVGDVTSFSNNIVTNAGRGVGFSTRKIPAGFRRSNSEITLEETGPPGWEVELYRNNEFIDSMIIPDSGSILFNEVLIEWGNNKYELRLYGPYGENEVIEKTYNLDSNPLGKGDSAYGFYIFDPSQTIFGDDRSSSIKLNNAGGYFDYGVSEDWQVGVGFNQISNPSQFQDDEQIISLKNYLTLPGMLLENDIAFNSDLGYSQQTTLIGNIFERGTFGLTYQSSDDFSSSKISSTGKNEQFTMRMSNKYQNIPYNFAYQYSKDGFAVQNSFSNSVSYSPSQYLRVSHILSYSQTKQVEGNEPDNLYGTANLSTYLFDKIRLSGSILYDPKNNFEVLDSSSITAQYSYKMANDIQHNVNFQYRPIADVQNSWDLNYNTAWTSNAYRLSFNASYNENKDWSFGLYVDFFLGYDHHNNRAMMSSNVNPFSATLNVDTYLDRQLNGYRDPLDYPLEGVSFIGAKAWEGILSGDNGKVRLPGTAVNSPFSFSAHSKVGSQTINNDYVVFTHPGAVLNVNMPFYLSTEFSGFVFRARNNIELPAQGIELLLIDKEGNIRAKQTTDIDGFYEFLNVKPNLYQLIVNKESLKSKSLTGDVIGFNFNTPTSGGYAELPDILLESISSFEESGKEEAVDMNIDNLAESLVWEEDEKIEQNYFLMPLKEKSVKASHVTRVNNEPQIEITNSADEITLLEANLSDKYLKNDGGDERTTKIGDFKEDIYNKMASQKEFYYIQLGAFNSISSAAKFLSSNNFEYPGMALVTHQKNKTRLKPILRIIIGEFNTLEQAKTKVLALGIQSDKFYIVKMNEAEIIERKLLTKAPESAVLIQPLIKKSDIVENEPMNGWVVQLYAGKLPVQKSIINQYMSVTKLIQAIKIVAGEKYYCLLSQRFTTKSEALRFIADNNLGGWAVELNNYQTVFGEETDD
jgi:hypothetical protein